MCNNCGRALPNPDTSLREECKQERKRKAKECLVKTEKIAGVAAAVVGTVYFASQLSNENEESYTPLSS